MKRFYRAYSDLFGILYAASPFVVVSVFASAIITGVIVPASVWVNSRVFNVGLEIAGGGAHIRGIRGSSSLS